MPPTTNNSYVEFGSEDFNMRPAMICAVMWESEHDPHEEETAYRADNHEVIEHLQGKMALNPPPGYQIIGWYRSKSTHQHYRQSSLVPPFISWLYGLDDEHPERVVSETTVIAALAGLN